MNIEKREIIRAKENPPERGSWPLQKLDQTMLSMVIRGTWIFEGTIETEALKTGLSKLLQYYPHLAGRMAKGKVVNFTNDGIPLILAEEASISIDDARENRDMTDRFSAALNKRALRMGKEALMAVQVTKLKDGRVLGISCSHACLDGASFYLMAANLGRLVRGEAIELPVLDQTLLPAPEGRTREETVRDATGRGWKKPSLAGLLKVLPHLISGNALKRTRGFYFSPGLLKKLKEKARALAGCACGTHASLSAYLAQMCCRLFGHTGSDLCNVVTVIDGRGRLPGVSPALAGNAACTIPSPDFTAGGGPGEAARTIQQGLAPYVQQPSRELTEVFILIRELLDHKVMLIPNDLGRTYRKKPTSFYINNFSRLPVYDVDFGSGKPVCAIPHNLSDPIVIWPAPPAKGGVEVYFTGFIAMAVNQWKEGEWRPEEMVNFGLIKRSEETQEKYGVSKA